MNAEAAPSDFLALKGRSIQRLWVLALDQNGALELRRGDIELLLDDGSEIGITFDYDRGLVLDRHKATLPPYDVLSDWFDLRKSYGVIVRAELPESSLRSALYGANIDEITVENDPNFPDSPIRVRVGTTQIAVLIGVEDTICTIDFEPRF